MTVQDMPAPATQWFAGLAPSSSPSTSSVLHSLWSTQSASSVSSASPTTTELPTPPPFPMFESELDMDHIFRETIDTSFLDSRPSSPTAFSLPVLGSSGKIGGQGSGPSHPLSPSCPPSLTLSLPHFPDPAPPAASFATAPRPSVAEAKRQIDVLTTILTSPNLLPTSLPTHPLAARPRSLSSSSAAASRAKSQLVGSAPLPSSSSNKSHKSWLDALKEAELKAKAKKLATSGGASARL
ncbi:uncharacterized protein JCM15063_005511 [Sporobolomyces koalae]|uniref:uncharacterized protein n=1 Tax=Sporobolomyces koalae TaxID=500713 RepID=UPI003170CC3D